MGEYGFQELEALDILFRRTQPEIVMERFWDRGGRKGVFLFEKDEAPYSYDLFDHYSRLGLWNFTFDESRQIYQFITEKLDALYEDRKNSKPNTYPGRNLFDLLWDYGNIALENSTGSVWPVCKLEEMLDWRSISYRLSQDLIICAWLAHSNPNNTRPELDWQPALLTNDKDLNDLLEKGLAENHFHLHGSTQSFALNWACLMNRPNRIEKVFAGTPLFRDNLEVNILRNARDHMEPWPARLCRAAMLRGLLFGRLVGYLDEETFKNELRLYDADPLAGRAQSLAETLINMYGKTFSLPGGGYSCLDYAISNKLCIVDDKQMVRLLTGERVFLYHCFQWQEAGKFTALESMAFYMYILLRNQFRSEMIQVNQRPGFRNFAYYQDRKSFFIDGQDDYYAETMRLSVARGIHDEKITSLEARITPRISESGMRSSYRETDIYLEHALRNQEYPYLFLNPTEEEDFRKAFDRSFYVIHFPKIPEKKSDIDRCELELLPRNGFLRRKNETQALVMRSCFTWPEDRKRIKGIDACTFEIGCRPDIYGTEMRFLRAADQSRTEYEWQLYSHEERLKKKLGLTYHVGEDYMDLADGLRAVDEAVNFLQMGKGDRIGHGLVLGVNAGNYYKKKHNIMHLHAQDRLDDLVWILYRGDYFLTKYGSKDGADILQQNRAALADEAGNLYEYIYKGNKTSDWMPLYYQAWELRGDHPDLYRKGTYDPNPALRADPLYVSCMINLGTKNLVINHKIRNKREIASLYYRYHFDYDARRRGYKDHRFQVETWYCRLMQYLQEAMRKCLIELGVLIEANPSSNLVIGPLDTYEDHPVFTFHPIGTIEKSLSVSLNTDDIGVFDTTLSNEYALILAAARKKTSQDTGIENEDILEWLEKLRQTGIKMSFL